MKRFIQIFIFAIAVIGFEVYSQSSSPAPYCSGGYTQGNCLQGSTVTNSPGNFVNDFIDFFRTVGGNVNIQNDSSGCNQNTNNFALYCNHYLQVTPGQLITCQMKSGITFAQGFAIFIDWNQDFTFQVPAEQVAATSNVPPAATWTTMAFAVPAAQPPGAYRMRVRCAFSTPGTNITPCGVLGFGETEDYTLFVGPPPPNMGVVTATATANAPVCAGQNVTLSVATNFTTGMTYTWTGPNNFTSTLQTVVLANSSPTMNGTYSVIADNGNCPTSKTASVLVVPYPNFQVSPSTHTICQGGSFMANAAFPVAINPIAYGYSWKPAPGMGIFSPLTKSTNITPPLLPVTQSLATIIYSVTITPTTLNCPVTKSMTLTINNPLTPTLNMPALQCNTFPQVQLTAIPGGGTWSASNAVGPGGLLTPALAAIGTNTVQYSVAVGSCVVSNTGTFHVSQFHAAALTSSLSLICVQDAPHDLLKLVSDTVAPGYRAWSGPNVSAQRYFSPATLTTGIYAFTYSTWSTPVASVCPHTTVLSLQVFSPPTPIISRIDARCTNEPTVALSATPAVNGTWSNNPGVSATGIQTPSLSPPGTNTVTYTSGQGTCVASSSATFHVSQFRTAALTATIPHQCFNSPAVNLLGIVQNTTGTWSGQNVNNQVFTTGGLATGNYTLSYHTTSSPDPLLCPDSRTTVVHVLNPPVPVIHQLKPVCSIEVPVQLTVTPATGQWLASPYLTPAGVLIPSLAAIGSNPVTYVIGTPTCNTSDTRLIQVENFNPATITGNLPELCDNSMPVSLAFITQSSNGTWMGPGVSVTNFDPAKTGAGTFQLSHHTSSSPSGLCPDVAYLTVTVHSLAAPYVAEAGPYCNSSAPLQFTVSPVGGLFGAQNSQAVTPGGLFYPGNAALGDNLMSYSISNGPCVANTQFTVSVVKFVSAEIAQMPEVAYCRNNEPFNLNSFARNPGGLWLGNAVTGSMFDPAKAMRGANTLTYQTFSQPDSMLCRDTRTLSIHIDDIPAVSLTSHKQVACAPAEILFHFPNGNDPRASGSWHFGDGTEPVEGITVPHLYTTPGSYSVVFNYALGACKAQGVLAYPITIKKAPTADFTQNTEEITLANPDVLFLNNSTNAGTARYEWSVNGEPAGNDINLAQTFEKTGLYEVNLKATTVDGCTHETSKMVEVKHAFGVYVPDAFTPGFDELNDVFRPVFTPYGFSESGYSLEIFDRWGQSIFRSTNVATGWDGRLKGTDTFVENGVYLYIINYRDAEGNAYQSAGHVTVIQR